MSRLAKSTATPSRNGRSDYTPLDSQDILPPLKNKSSSHTANATDALPPTSPLNSALALLSSGHSDLSAVKFLREGHNLSLEQAQAALEGAYEQLTGSHRRSTEQKMALALEQRMKIVAAAFDSQDYRIALSAMEQREKLLGLTGPEALGGNEFAANLLQLLDTAARSGNLTDRAVEESDDAHGL